MPCGLPIWGKRPSTPGRFGGLPYTPPAAAVQQQERLCTALLAALHRTRVAARAVSIWSTPQAVGCSSPRPAVRGGSLFSCCGYIIARYTYNVNPFSRNFSKKYSGAQKRAAAKQGASQGAPIYTIVPSKPGRQPTDGKPRAARLKL